MNALLVVAFAAVQIIIPSGDVFEPWCELQGLYNQASQTVIAARTVGDIDLLHAVMDTPDFVFIDRNGERYTWERVRERQVQALNEPRLDSLKQTIQKVSLTPQGATVIATVTTVRTALSETITVRDSWVKAAAGWRRSVREELMTSRP
jgi:hypothetical protein